jgi:raffinose/stachyose/melibiose transport system substrate-binding protein
VINRGAMSASALSLSAWLAACGGSDEPAKQPASAANKVPPADLEFWWWGNQNYPGQKKVMRQLFAEYLKEHPDTKIKDVLQGTDETIPSYQAAAKAKKGPDIGTLWYGAYMFPEVWKGNVAPLSDLIPESETKHWMDAKFASYDGKIYASGVSGDGAAILYNKDHFRKAKLDPDNPPTTWTDLVDAVKKLKAAGFIPFSTGVKDGFAGVVFMNFVVPQQAGGSPASLLKQACSGDVSWTDPRLANLWERLEELKGVGAFNDNATSLEYFEGKQQFDAGEASMTFTGAITFAIHSVNKQGEDKVGILAAPDLEDKKGGFIPGMPLTQVITPYTKDKEAAAALLTWLHQPKAQGLMYELSDGVMIPTDDRWDFGQVEKPWLKKVYDQVVDAMERDIPYADGIVPFDILGEGPMKAMTLTFAEDLGAAQAATMCQEAAENWQKLNPDLVDLYKKWSV